MFTRSLEILLFLSYLLISVVAQPFCSEATYCPSDHHCCTASTCCPNNLVCCGNGQLCCQPEIDSRLKNVDENLNYQIPKIQRNQMVHAVNRQQNQEEIGGPLNINNHNNMDLNGNRANFLNTGSSLDLQSLPNLGGDYNLQLPRKKIFKFYYAKLPNVQEQSSGSPNFLNIDSILNRASLNDNANEGVPKTKVYKLYYPEGAKNPDRYNRETLMDVKR
ncbi:hypothetical protein O3M35_008478 [Rhynocoris fuscipes]|uniref:Uncharacterized protein n=1 Tax=Rhynocoris fuscipes TaxID=488301 RepID=A0AAW1D9Y1_9HEMI